MSASGRGGGRRRLIATLERHGLTTATADVIRTLGSDLRERMLRFMREFAALADVQAGTRLGEVLSGEPDGIELGPLLRSMEPGHRYANVHTHPDSTSFSPTDVALALRFPAVCVIAAVGADGTWYVLSIESDQPPTREAMFAAYVEEREAAAPRYEPLVQAGTMTRRAARRELSHEVWLRASRRLRLRYDRMEARS